MGCRSSYDHTFPWNVSVCSYGPHNPPLSRPHIRTEGDDLLFLHERVPLTTIPVSDTTHVTCYRGAHRVAISHRMVCESPTHLRTCRDPRPEIHPSNSDGDKNQFLGGQ